MEKFWLKLIVLMIVITITEQLNYVLNPEFRPTHYIGPDLYEEKELFPWKEYFPHTVSFQISTWQDENVPYHTPLMTLLKIKMIQDGDFGYFQRLFLRKGFYRLEISLKGRKYVGSFTMNFEFCDIKLNYIILPLIASVQETRFSGLFNPQPGECLLKIYSDKIEKHENFAEVLISNVRVTKLYGQ